jgi:hypothetical protein
MKRDLYAEVSTRIVTDLEAGRAKIVLCGDLIPDIGVFSQIRCQACWHVRPGFDAEGFGRGRWADT